VRWALLIDAATLTLADIATAIATLPPATDPWFASLAEPLRQRLAGLQSVLAQAPKAARSPTCSAPSPASTPGFSCRPFLADSHSPRPRRHD